MQTTVFLIHVYIFIKIFNLFVAVSCSKITKWNNIISHYAGKCHVSGVCIFVKRENNAVKQLSGLLNIMILIIKAG